MLDRSPHSLPHLPLATASYFEDLAKVADALSNYTYTTSEGETVLIPIIFRLLHEPQGSWYWWGNGTASITRKGGDSFEEHTCATEDYQLVWERTVEFFNEKGFDNLLWMYAPASPYTYGEAKVLERLPKLTTVDMIGVDQYVQPSPITHHPITHPTKSPRHHSPPPPSCHSHHPHQPRTPKSHNHPTAFTPPNVPHLALCRYTLMGEYKEYMQYNCDLAIKIADEYDLIPAIAETGISDGMQDVNASLWYYDVFTETLKSGRLGSPTAHTRTCKRRHRLSPPPLLPSYAILPISGHLGFTSPHLTTPPPRHRHRHRLDHPR